MSVDLHLFSCCLPELSKKLCQTCYQMRFMDSIDHAPYLEHFGLEQFFLVESSIPHSSVPVGGLHYPIATDKSCQQALGCAKLITILNITTSILSIFKLLTACRCMAQTNLQNGVMIDDFFIRKTQCLRSSIRESFKQPMDPHLTGKEMQLCRFAPDIVTQEMLVSSHQGSSLQQLRGKYRMPLDSLVGCIAGFFI